MNVTIFNRKKLHNVFFNTFLCVSCIISLMFAPSISYATWAFDSVNNRISDGDWTLNVSLSGDSSELLTITGVYGVTTGTVLDLSASVTDSKTIVAIGEGAFEWRSYIVEVYLPSAGLKGIGKNAFLACTGIKSIEPFLPNSIEAIGMEAFHGCTSLTNALILATPNLDTIPYNAFRNTAIPSVDMTGSGIKTIGVNSFYYIGSLTNVILSSCLEIVEREAFLANGKLANVEPFLPSSVIYVGPDAFHACVPLTNALVLSNSNLVSISASAFRNTAISSVDMTGSGVKTINVGAFQDSRSITNVIFSSCLESVKDSVFYTCTTLIHVEPFLPPSVTNVEWYAFKNTVIVGALVLSSPDMTEIVNEGFNGYQSFTFAGYPHMGITSIDMSGSGIRKIGTYAFNHQLQLGSVIFGDKLEVLDDCVFYDSTITQVWFCGDIPIFGQNVFTCTNRPELPMLNARFYIPFGNGTWDYFRANDIVLLDPADEQYFKTMFPYEKAMPIGKFIPPGAGNYQYVCEWRPPTAEKLITVLIIK